MSSDYGSRLNDIARGNRSAGGMLGNSGVPLRRFVRVPATGHEWWETHDNIVRLGRWLIEHYHYDCESLQEYYERPHAYSYEWERMQSDEVG